MIKGENIAIEVQIAALNGPRFIALVTTVILNSINYVYSFGNVEEIGVSISLSEPVNTGFESLEFLLILENNVELSGETHLKIMKTRAIRVVRDFWILIILVRLFIFMEKVTKYLSVLNGSRSLKDGDSFRESGNIIE